jgi:acyl-CoA dehydrogenase
VGGDVRTSLCAVEQRGDAFTLDKQASVISYGEHADDLLVTARRGPEAAPSDQVLALVRRSECELERTSGWDTLGMRGTCSPGFRLRARGSTEQILPVPFADVSAQTMLPVSHILWASVWLGIATDAIGRAGAFVRAEARRRPGVTPPGALRLAEATGLLHTMRATVDDAARAYEASLADPDALAGIGFTVRMNNLKIAASQLVVQIVGQALSICGIAGYRVDSPYSVERQLRDAHSAALMVSNDRIHGVNATLLLVHRDV